MKQKQTETLVFSDSSRIVLGNAGKQPECRKCSSHSLGMLNVRIVCMLKTVFTLYRMFYRQNFLFRTKFSGRFNSGANLNHYGLWQTNTEVHVFRSYLQVSCECTERIHYLFFSFFNIFLIFQLNTKMEDVLKKLMKRLEIKKLRS